MTQIDADFLPLFGSALSASSAGRTGWVHRVSKICHLETQNLEPS